MRRPFVLAALAAASLLAACAVRDEPAPDAALTDEVEGGGHPSLEGDLTIDAELHAGMGGLPGADSLSAWTAGFHVAPDGVATVTIGPGQPDSPVHRVALTADERARLRRIVERSEFFGAFGPNLEATDGATWNVTIRCGERTQTREAYLNERFRETAEFLSAVLVQAEVEIALERRRLDWIDSYVFRRDALLHPDVVIVGLIDRVGHASSAAEAGVAIAALRELVSPAEFKPVLDRALSDGDDTARRLILGPLVDKPIAAPLHQRDAVLPAALAELERSWRNWKRPPEERARFLADCAQVLAMEHEVRAAPLFERMVAELSTDAHPVPMAALAALGDAAIEPLERLLDDERFWVRIAAAQTCEGLACELTSPSACARPPGVDPAKLLPVFRERIVPRLERAADEPGDPRLRAAAAEALVDLGVRERPPGWKWHRLDWR